MRNGFVAGRFCVILERLRTERGWSLFKCAQRMGMSPTHLRVLEQGGNMPGDAVRKGHVRNIAASEIVREIKQRKETGRVARRVRLRESAALSCAPKARQLQRGC
jgi:transcriptional regulator with XRE-family HTH domain